jgi:hypothetical protein
MVLVVLFLYFNVYTFIQARNDAYQDTVSQVAQMDTDRNAEQLSILANPYVTINGSQVDVKYVIVNTGPIAVHLVRLWVLESPSNTTGNSVMNVALQSGSSNANIVPINITWDKSKSPTFTIQFVSARGNIFTPNQNPTGGVRFVGSVTVSTQFPQPVPPGRPVTYTVTVYRGVLNDSFTASLTISQLPTPTSYSFTPSMLVFEANVPVMTSTLTINTTISTPLASSVFAVTAMNIRDSYDRASGFGVLTVGGPGSRETGSIKMDWTTIQFYDFKTTAPGDKTNITSYLRTWPSDCQLPKDHYIMFAALFTNLDPLGRDINLTSDTCIWAINPSEGTVKNPLLLPIVNVTNGIYRSHFSSLVLYYNKPTMVYFFDSSGTIPKESYYSGGAIPLSIIFYGNTVTGYYGQNIPWIAVKFT